MRFPHPALLSLAVIGSLTCSGLVGAWIVKEGPVKELLDQSTLVVVATPLSNKVLTAQKILPAMPSGETADPNVYVDDVATMFKVSAVVKGLVDGGLVVLHHQRFTNGHYDGLPGPALMDFKPGSGMRYLMFLTREPNGYAVAVSGPVEAALAVVAVNR